ncbi:cell division protein PerM [Streptomyces sp. NBC_01497]|uniref:cell division protein PerM n=1 Tax=Streptomyces sp. NBC_01497 TaxID=2903885 RepID=UPI002E32CEB8|nr:DUF6350 family protein [Streptomyces sp. NBC_01497]
MTQVTERGELLSSASALERGRAAALTASFLRGSIAACLGLGTLAVLVMALWISSPYPDSGAGGALHVAVALWLLAHGIDLVRPGTLSGAPAPVGIVPLLLVALPGYLAYRAARDALEPQEGRPQLTALGAVATVSGGYLLVGAGAVAYAHTGAFTAAPLRAAAVLPAFVIAVTGAGAWSAVGRPAVPLPRWLPHGARAWCARTLWSVSARRLTGLAVRAGAASAAVLLGCGAVLVALSLVRHGHTAQESFLRLSMVWSGRFAVLLLGLVLVPNAAVWAAAYGLGPGFALNTATTVTPFAALGDPGLPSFPLLAAVPQGVGGWQHWSAAFVPVAAGLTVGAFTLHKAAPAFVDREEAWSAGDTVLAAGLGGVVAGALTALLAALAGGPLGTASLARFGPLWWTTGVAALLWTVAVAVPYVLVVRAWRVRRRAVHHAVEVTQEPALAPPGGTATAEDATAPGRWSGLLLRVTRRTRAADPAVGGSEKVNAAPMSAPAETGATGTDDGTAHAAEAAGSAGGAPVAADGTRAQPGGLGHAVAPARRWTRPWTWLRRRTPADAATPGAGTAEGYDFLSAESWHERGAREARWAGLKQVSGGLMADFSSEGRPWSRPEPSAAPEPAAETPQGTPPGTPPEPAASTSAEPASAPRRQEAPPPPPMPQPPSAPVPPAPSPYPAPYLSTHQGETERMPSEATPVEDTVSREAPLKVTPVADAPARVEPPAGAPSRAERPADGPSTEARPGDGPAKAAPHGDRPSEEAAPAGRTAEDGPPAPERAPDAPAVGPSEEDDAPVDAPVRSGDGPGPSACEDD